MTVIDFNQWRGDAPRAEIDYPTLAQLALPHARKILEKWMPGGKVVGREYLCATTQGGAGTSCSTNITTGVGGDFATDQTWGDLIKLVTVVDAVAPHEAAARIARFIGADLTKPLPPLPPIATPSPEEKYLAGREAAKRMLAESEPCPADFPYLARKGVRPAEGVKFHRPTGNMLVPLFDEKGELWSVQRISPDSGEKKINEGGRLSGNFFTFPGDSATVYLAEGYATAATVRELTGQTVVMGITSGNLSAVAEALSRLYPGATLIVAGDADDAGRKAAAKVQEKVPRFKAVFPPKEGDDWNDLSAREDAEAVRAAIDTAMGGGAEKSEPGVIVLEEMKAESARDLLSTQTLPVDEVFAGLLARGEVLTLGGPPKSGKSYFALQAALCAAAGEALLGCDVPHPFKILYVIAEGSRRRLKDRLLNAIPYIPGIEDEDFNRLYVVDTRGMLQIDTDAGEKTLLRLAEPFDLIILDTLYALQGRGDENSHRDFRGVSGPLNRLKHSAGGKAVLLIHHVRKNSGEDAGADELRGAGFAGFSDAVIRLYKRRGRMGIHYELKFDLRNYAEREDLLLTRMGPLFAPIDANSSKIDLQNYVVATITERGGKVEGRETLVKLLVALTKMKRQTCINAIGEAILSGRVDSAPMPGKNTKVYFLTDGNDDEE